MEQTKTLIEAYNQASYPLIGHGKRNVQVLKEALEQWDAEQDSDMYGNGAIIENFEEKMAKLLGKESTVFFPSGTMAQQIALRIWCDEKGNKKVGYHPLSHLEIHEKDGMKELHHLEAVLLADVERPVLLHDLIGLEENIACLLLELPQREIGGQLPEFAELKAMSAFCRERGIKLHLDGARLFEILPYYDKSAQEVCALFDSVYISFYKGIGGIAGAILAGDRSFTEKSKIWKRRHGGDLISLYPYIIAADYYMERRLPHMKKYYREAQELAALYNGCEGMKTIPEVPVSNMFHVHTTAKKEQLDSILIDIAAKTGIGLSQSVRDKGEEGCYFEVNIGDRYDAAPKETLFEAFRLLDNKLQQNGERE
ncbi:low specificity L-threonine aldolase [Paenibacillus sp. FSL A5-0031]|uniref:threonine aldolase family protein n=1 Tax=Paenibacillus sp. FSL A5-0031 TaxID=1920420 RepID=UPI00096C4D95|nr:beta-eliminating lyase-related protein [Paenibacillus sp. FSL A5-0031]OME82123.1 low specificity L-threonine aldolase [Paenibacillus sp. FSL A5-0031]